MPVVAWTVRAAGAVGRGQGRLRQPDLRGLRRVTAVEAGGAASTAASPRSAARPGTPAPATRLCRQSVHPLRLPGRRWRRPAAPIERTGWGPQHLSVEDEAGRVAAVMPLYLKTHSQGEYVFDHAWADAYERAGGRYYPKLQCAAPFTPVTGPRLLVRPDVDRRRRPPAAAGRRPDPVRPPAAPRRLHVTFPTEDEWGWMGEQRPAAAPGPAVPLVQPRLRATSTTSWRPCRPAAARPSAASAATPRPGWRSSP